MRKTFFVMMAAVVGVIVLTGVTGVMAQQNSPAGQGQYVENMGAAGSVNWSTGILTAVGIGAPPERFYGKPQARPMAMRAAQVDAYRKLLEVAQGVRINATTTVRDYAVESDVVRTQVEGLVRGARIAKTEYLSDGTVEVTVVMPMTGASVGLGQAIYPKILAPPSIPMTPPSGYQPPVPPSGYPATPTLPQPSQPQAQTPAPAPAPTPAFLLRACRCLPAFPPAQNGPSDPFL